MADNLTSKNKNQELDILIENILRSQKQESKTPSTPKQKMLEIRSNLINGAEQNQHKRGGKANETSNKTGGHKERQSKAQTKMHKRSETNAIKQSEETQRSNSNVHSNVPREQHQRIKQSALRYNNSKTNEKSGKI